MSRSLIKTEMLCLLPTPSTMRTFSRSLFLFLASLLSSFFEVLNSNIHSIYFFSFGSKLRSTVSGIIYNNELADYFTNSSYSADENGKVRNYPKPIVNAPLGGRRPLSSTCPSVIVDNNGDVKMVVGGSGGTRITLSTAWV